MGTAGSQTFIAATVVLMILTPLLMRVGNLLSGKITQHSEQNALPEDFEAQIPAHAIGLEDHVIVAGYGQAARCLVRVLNGSGIPYIITTLSPDGANEAEAEGLPVVRGDATRQFLLQLVGVDKAKMMVIADDNPAMAHRITMVARQQNPTMRIVVRTRYTAEVEELTEAGADTVIAEELESIVQLFGEVLRDYRIAPEEIEDYEALARQNGYSALLKADLESNKSVFACETGDDCKDSRTVKVREGMPVAEKSFGDLQFAEAHKLHLQAVKRAGEIFKDPALDFILRPGDELVLAGSTNAFAQNAALFRAAKSAGDLPAAKTAAEALKTAAAFKESGNTSMIDTEKAIDYQPEVDESVCAHLGQIKKVYPSAAGCEECLQSGDAWVHLRICLVCGHMGCCDDSKNKHATAHFHESNHSLIKSMERGEDWAWCYQDEAYL